VGVASKRFAVATKGDTEIIDITNRVATALRESELAEGTLTVFVPGSTAGLTTLEYEPGLVQDLQRAFEHLAARNQAYSHDARWGDGNGHSHVRASVLGPSLSVPFSKGEMLLGTWQQIVLIDFDNRPRNRELIVQLIGE
jgi:secondary thiamine-phosphate synthase enzyme